MRVVDILVGGKYRVLTADRDTEVPYEVVRIIKDRHDMHLVTVRQSGRREEFGVRLGQIVEPWHRYEVRRNARMAAYHEKHDRLVAMQGRYGELKNALGDVFKTGAELRQCPEISIIFTDVEAVNLMIHGLWEMKAQMERGWFQTDTAGTGGRQTETDKAINTQKKGEVRNE